MRSKAWLVARLSLRLARLPRTASSAQRSRRLRSTRAAAPVLLAHADVTENIKYFSMGPKLRHPTVAGRHLDGSKKTLNSECSIHSEGSDDASEWKPRHARSAGCRSPMTLRRVAPVSVRRQQLSKHAKARRNYHTGANRLGSSMMQLFTAYMT